jgi:hypothetical protein
MSKQNINIENFSKQLFESHGFTVSKIEETDEQRCDFILNDDKHSYLLEIKEREMNEDIKQNLKTEGVYVHPTKPISFDNRIKAIIKKGVKQILKTSEVIDADFKIICFSIMDEFDSPDYERLSSTLYGLRRLCFTNKGSNTLNVATSCFYYGHSCFHTFKDLDAVIVLHSNGYGIFMNNFSKKYENFKSSFLYSIFDKEDAITDPIKLEGKIYLIADCDVDRNDTQEVNKFLCEKYGVSNIIPFAYEEHTISTIYDAI